MHSAGRTEIIYRKLSVGLLLVCVLLGFTTIADYGMGWDEVTRWKSGDAKVDYYQALIHSEDRMAVVRGAPNEPYPGLFDMSLSIVHRVTGWDRFRLGHWQAFIFGLVGLAAVWRIGQIFGGARLAFWSALLLILTPVFYGHWFHNPKDIPFAATYTVGLLGLIEWLRRYPDFKKRWVLLAAIACGLCMATRIAGMVLLAYAAAGVAVVALIQVWEQRTERNWKASARGSLPWLLAWPVIALGAYIALLPWWPAAHKNFLSVSGSTLQRLHVSASEIPLFFRGEYLLAADAPHAYTLWMFAIKAPELLLVGLLLALAMGGLLVRKRLQSSEPTRGLPALAVLLLGGFFPLLYLTYSAPALHNGARHFLFAFPALCVCAAWGYLQFADWVRVNRPSMWRIAQLTLGVLVFLPLMHLVKLHPYQYVYFNALAGGSAAAIECYEGEYWYTSSKHAIEQLQQYLIQHPDQLPVGRTARILILGPWQVAEPFLLDGFELTGDPNHADFLILNTQMQIYRNFEGEELFRIQRMGAPICVVLRAQ